MQKEPLITFESVCGALSGGGMRAYVRHFPKPALKLRIKVCIVDELTAVEEVLPHVAYRPLHLTFRFGSIRSARPSLEAPVVGKANKLDVLDQRSALFPPVLNDDRFHLVEQYFLRHTAEEPKCLLKPRAV